MDYERRIKRIENILGLNKEKKYRVIHYGYWPIERIKSQGKICWEKGRSKGPLLLTELHGKAYGRSIDPASEEGKKILYKLGYQEVKL